MGKKQKLGKKMARNDKWYKLAKAQGYRSRAAFKLTQLNKKYGFLEKSTVLLDLCAAPGGWCQVASKYMPKGSQIIGLDLVQMRPIPGVTMYDEFSGGDIMSSKCRSVLKRDLKNKKADVVLHDGAPNVGAAWTKDAYGQSELVLMSCKLACEFLKKGGIFITKVFRSSDYNSLMWVMNKLFGKVESFKPASSRSQSAEIFVVCQNFIAPDKLDPRLLDPKFAFKQVEMLQPVPDVLHKKIKQKKNRQGYDDAIGQGMFAACSVASFVECDNTEHMQMLGAYNQMKFDSDSTRYLEHEKTTQEVRDYFDDLKLLGRSEYKLLLVWRTKMRNIFSLQEAQAKKGSHKKAAPVEEESEEEVDDSPEARRALLEEQALDRLERLAKKKKREKKKEREAKIKLQKKKDMGIDQTGTYSALAETGDHLFTNPKNKSIQAAIRSGRDGILSALIPEDELSNSDSSENHSDDDDVGSEEEERLYMEKLERDAMSHHQRIKELKEKRPAGWVKPLTPGQHMIKRKQAAREEFAEKSAKAEEYRTGAQADRDYLNLLAKNIGDSGSDDDDDDGPVGGGNGNDDENYDSSDVSEDDTTFERDKDRSTLTRKEEENYVEPVNPKKRRRGGEKSGVSALEAAAGRAKASASRWFSNPAFAATMPEMTTEKEEEMAGALLNDANSDDEGEGDLSHLKMEIDEMPKTDKQIRHEKRLRLAVQKEKKEERKTKKELRLMGAGLVDQNSGLIMEEVRGEESDDDDDGGESNISDEHRKLIRAGMGASLDDDVTSGFETVSAVEDTNNNNQKRKREETGWSSSDTDGDDEEEEEEVYVDPVPNKLGQVKDGYESDDETRAHTLAMGTLMAFSHARAKELIDASYNRYSFTDTNLPEWFEEDEKEHNRPQMPITKEMVRAAKARFLEISNAPIKKVAEARARKKMRLVKAVEKAKKLANRIAEDTDMSTRSKMRAIEKAMLKSRVQKTGSVTVKVTKNNGASKSGHGKGVRVKFADKRMRSDQRGRERAANKGKKKRKIVGKGKNRTRHFN